jgi:hypothetical protein
VISNNALDQVLLPRELLDIPVGPPRLTAEGLGVLLEPPRLPQDKGFELLEEQPLAPQEEVHPLGRCDGQIPFEKHPVEAGQYTCNLLGVFLDECVVHGVPLPMTA